MVRCYREQELRRRARQMRNNPTPSEAELWARLRRRQLDGRKFRRQHVLQPFIVDFYCVAEKLVIEVDGAYHQMDQERHQTRATYLREHYGVRILRFRAEDVLTRPMLIAEHIRASWEP